MTETEIEVPAHAPVQTHQQQPMSNGDSTPLRTLCAQLHEQITAFLQEDVQTEMLKNVQAQTRHSLGIISEALERYPLPALSLSYNGGKDCLVLLILYLSLLSTHPHLPTTNKLESILIPPPHPFPLVDNFIASSSEHYHLNLARYSSPSMKDAFREYLGGKGSGVEAIFVGTRRTDPHGGKLGAFDPTDGGWPAFMRVHPVLEWRYGEVWTFLRHFKIPYCELYDHGYTSLGGTNDTHPNPALKIEGKEGAFRPAYELEIDSEERLGRDW
ncbi:3'-phosphoadenosine 5'-phosphosulfate sulfotransferase [Mycoblastus sanguinarius]|nr:3'-phosphoadenosine 5'-phosphosulfate sulfotransferase [Mycoblastus sanguinarius]